MKHGSRTPFSRLLLPAIVVVGLLAAAITLGVLRPDAVPSLQETEIPHDALLDS